jgi:hypothetical protein
MNCIAGLNQWVLSVGEEQGQGPYQNKGPCETTAEHYPIVVMPLLICFTERHEQAHILFFIYFSHDMRIYKNRMPTGVELSIFRKPGGILHSARCSLHTLEKSEQVIMNTTISFLLLFSILHFLSLWCNELWKCHTRRKRREQGGTD